MRDLPALGLLIGAAASPLDAAIAKLSVPPGRRWHGRHVKGKRAKAKAKKRRRNKIAAATRRSMRHA